MISIKNVSKYYGRLKALDNVSVDIPTGSIHGIIGENGAGKTTLIHCLTGIYKCSEGAVSYDGEPVYDNPAVKAGIGYVADSCNYFPNASINEMVRFYKGMYPTFDESEFERLNAIFKLDASRKVKQLSKGMQMRLALMLNISIRPDALILDEPTSGLDAVAKKQVMDILIEEADKRGCTIVISSHHLSELEKLCDGVTMLENGSVLFNGSVEDMKERVVKLQAVFRNDADISDIEGVLNIEKIGSIYYIITDKYSPELEKELYSRGAELVERIGMSLEEIFIYTYEGRE